MQPKEEEKETGEVKRTRVDSTLHRSSKNAMSFLPLLLYSGVRLLLLI